MIFNDNIVKRLRQNEYRSGIRNAERMKNDY